MTKRKRTKARSKNIVLDSNIWVKSTDIAAVRKQKLLEQDGNCAITGNPVQKPVLDHLHLFYEDNCDINPYQEEGRCRGVLESQVNTLEGRYLTLYCHARIQEKYGISFPDMLISMGEYLKQDNSQEKFHYMYMEEKRKKVRSWRKDVLISNLKQDFNVTVDEKTLVKDLVQIYMQLWVNQIDKSF